jgi:hypothetical protein
MRPKKKNSKETRSQTRINESLLKILLIKSELKIMAHKKGAGSTKMVEIQTQRLGVKRFGGEQVRAGNILFVNVE